MKGKLICIEGADSVGKTTLLNNLKEEYKNGNYSFYNDNGGLELTDKLKDIVTHYDMNITSKSLIFAASRYQIYDIVKRDLENGINVIMDRSYYSSIIFQGFAKGTNCKYIMDINRYIPQPDILIILDCSEEEMERRLKERKELDLFEKDKHFQSMVREGYRMLFKGHIEDVELPKHTFKVDTSGTQDDTLKSVVNCISEVIYYGGDVK